MYYLFGEFLFLEEVRLYTKHRIFIFHFHDGASASDCLGILSFDALLKLISKTEKIEVFKVS